MTPPERRSPTSVGFQWASRVSAVGLELVLPALAGVYADRQFSSSPVGVLIGVFLGFSVMMMHILRIAREGSDS